MQTIRSLRLCLELSLALLFVFALGLYLNERHQLHRLQRSTAYAMSVVENFDVACNLRDVDNGEGTAVGECTVLPHGPDHLANLPTHTIDEEEDQ